MFEFSIALKYLLPNRSHKTLSFVGIIACGIIAVILWLLIVFVSIIQSIETQWLGKMTALSAPLRVKPTKYYFDSYYYQIDQFSEASSYKNKSLKDKLESFTSDPYNPDCDENIAHLPLPHRDLQGRLFDPVKTLVKTLDNYQKKGLFSFGEYALSAGALHLNFKKDSQSQTLNQILYLSSFNPQILDYGRNLDTWDLQDVNQLIRWGLQNPSPVSLQTLLDVIDIEDFAIEPFKLRLPEGFKLPHKQMHATADYNAEGRIKKVMLYFNKNSPQMTQAKEGLFDVKERSFAGQKIDSYQLYLDTPGSLQLEKIKESAGCRKFLFKADIEGSNYFFELEPQDFQITKFKVKKPLWPVLQKAFENRHQFASHYVLAPKAFKDQGAKVGDQGYISYGAKTLSGFQEMKAGVTVIGFYDPGLFSVGAKVLITSREFIDVIGTSATTYALDPSETNGFFLFTSSFKQAQACKMQLEKEFKELHLDKYFQIQTYQEYPFVKEIMQQFSADKLIFCLVGFIIFIVALTNVAFLMQILVRDKSREMAVIRSLGASVSSIVKIFLFTGLMLGTFSVAIAYFLAILTLSNLESLLKALSFIMGDHVNLSQFYGLSSNASISPWLLLSITALTPLLCALAAYIATTDIKRKSCSHFLKEPS